MRLQQRLMMQATCMSLTLRLLSLQSQGCVYVEEVYVFADPVDSADSEIKMVGWKTQLEVLL
jgi:hypothetical protein